MNGKTERPSDTRTEWRDGVMVRIVEVTEQERRLLARLVHEEWRRLDQIREVRSSFMSDDPILTEQLEVEVLEAKLR